MFSDKQRKIFKYHDGTKTKFGDPMKISERLYGSYGKDSTMSLDWEMIKNFQELKSEKAGVDALHAIERLYEHILRSFNLKPLNEEDGTGVTVEESLELIAEFGNYLEEVKKNSVVMPDLPPVTEQESSPVDPNQ